MILIQNGTVIDPATGTHGVLDVLLDGDRIVAIGPNLPTDHCEILDAAGLVVAPGLVDTHVHFREPGFTYKEDIDTGAAAAARGGFTTVVCMANTKPAIDSVDTLRQNIARGESTPIRVLQAAAITMGLQGQTLTDFAALKDAGAVGFTDDGIAIKSAALTRAAMELARSLDMPLSFHEEDPSLLTGAGVNEGDVSRQLGMNGAASVAEDVLVARDCMLALATGARVVIQHISSAASVELVRTAKRIGADVHAEATPHHFAMNETAVLTHGTLAKMNPPLRTEADRQAILDGLRDGTIDIIATDHAPHAAEEKAKPLTEAPSGIIGLETALALGITHLVQTGILTLPRLLEKMATNPARCYRLPAGSLREGGLADLVLFDENERWTVKDFASKSANSPFVGETLAGKVKCTVCRGKIVYRDMQ
jgi:dihydroorotase